tara:strand:- start:12551 stop:13588 length:1038 start_codon:yes stop_codon:yes gene_type:complete
MPQLSLKKIAEITNTKLYGDDNYHVSDIGPLESAQEGDLSFLSSSKYKKYLHKTRATAVILSPEDLDSCPVCALVSDNPYLAYTKAAKALIDERKLNFGVHPTATVEHSAKVHSNSEIGANCYIGRNVVIEEGVRIAPGCVIGEESQIKSHSDLMANVTLGVKTIIGKRCLIHPGAVIGSDGFGFANDNGSWVKAPQLGGVVIGNDVEVGSCSTIDRGAITDTILGDGVKLDNQVHIAHNVQIGSNTAIAAQVGIAGSTKIGAFCTIAGKAGIAGHIEIADKTNISGFTAVTKSIKISGTYTSTIPAIPHEKWRKNFSRLKQLDDLSRRLKKLEIKINKDADEKS